MSDFSFLLIDDSNSDLIELEEILHSIGFEDVEFSDNASDAWSILRIRDFNCVIAAWDMPDMSGEDLFLRHQPEVWRQQIRVMA